MSDMASIKRAITAFDKAAQALAFAGAQPPEDRAELKRAHMTARTNLENLIAKGMSQ